MRVAAEDNGYRPDQGLGAPLVDMAHATHIGFGRASNQDAVWLAPHAQWQRLGILAAVADGMGGHNGGEIASRYACNALSGYYAYPRSGMAPGGINDLCRHLTDLVYRIDRGLRRQALKDPALEDMGTTLSCLVLTTRHALIAHAGDSRIYRLRRGRLSCLTEDHTFVREMIFEGELKPEDAENHPLRHLLTQAVGTGEPLEIVHARIDRLQAGDRFLLCTDGLYTAVKPHRIALQLTRDARADEIAAGLVDEALAGRTRDNVSVLVVKTHQPLHPAQQAGNIERLSSARTRDDG